jgi:hypothetical protein
MQGLYYLAMLIGVVWLAVWSILPPEQRQRGWWPFDMGADGAEEAGGTRPAAKLARTGQPTGGAKRTAPGTDGSDLRPPPAEPKTAPSWRVRRVQAQASRRSG